jgi:tetratricopeptide (TPR) repeat protein
VFLKSKNLLISIIMIVLITSTFSGCSSKEVVPGHVKAFEGEDLYIFYALDAQQNTRYESAVAYYDILFEKSFKEEYLLASYQMLSLGGFNDEIIKRVNTYFVDNDDAKSLTSQRLQRYKIAAYLRNNSVEEAKQEALGLLSQTKSVDDYIIVSEIYKLQKHYDTALKYLESAYIINYDEKIVDKMAIIMYVNLGKKSEAIAQLQTHSRLHGCSKKICSRLISFYSEQNNIEGLLSTYLRFYQLENSEVVAQQIIKIYGYQKDYLSLKLFLEESGHDNTLLIKIYTSNEEYKKAELLALEMYQKNNDVSYLGQSAIYLYESNSTKSLILVDETIKRLRKSVEVNPKPLFLNYLGYIMIDHDKDINAGMTYVKKALELVPDSAFYLDSLAWGYYKLNECDRALKLMQEVIDKLGSDDEEVSLHVNAIEKCIKSSSEKTKKLNKK